MHDMLVKEFNETLDLHLSDDQKTAMIEGPFERADKDGDGMLSLEEFVKFADHLDTIASSLGAAGHPNGIAQEHVATSPTRTKPKESKPMSLLGEDGVARMDLFEQFDINHDAKLDVDEAIDLLKTTLKEWEITTDWVTADWVGQQFRTVTGEGVGLVRSRALALSRVLSRFERCLRGLYLYRSLCSVRCVPVLARV